MGNKSIKILSFIITIFIYSNIYPQYTTKWDLRYLVTKSQQLPYKIYEDRNNDNNVNTSLGQFFGEVPFDVLDENNIILIDHSVIFTVDSLSNFDEVVQNSSQLYYRLRIIKSSDGGINWYTIYPDLYKNYSNQKIISIQYLNNNWIFFSGRTILHKNLDNLSQDTEQFSSITYSSDGGKNWTHCRIDTIFQNEDKNLQDITNIKMIDSLNGFAIINSRKNFKFISTNDCWKSYKIEYFTEFDISKTQRATSLDIHKTNTPDSTVIAITDTRGYILVSNNKGREFRSIKISNFFPKQVKILNKHELLILGTDSTIQDVNGRPQRGKFKVIKFNSINVNYQTVHINHKNEKSSDIFSFNEKNISVISGGKLLKSVNGGLDWEEQDIKPYYIKYASENTLFALANAYKSVPNTLQNSIELDYYAVYFTNGDSTLKKSTLYINGEAVPEKIITVDTTFCKISWSKVVGANYYFLTIYGEHKKSLDITHYPFYILNKKDNVWKKHEVIQLLTKDTSYIFQEIQRNMLYSIELYSLSSSDTLKSLPSIALFNSDSTILSKPYIFNPLNSSSINTKDIIIQWHPVEGATGYNLEVGEGGIYANKIYKIICKLKNYKLTNYLLKDLEPNKNYYIAISVMNDNDISNWSLINFSTESILSTTELSAYHSIPFPNPAHSTTRISLLQEGGVSIFAIDVMGRSFPLWSGYATSGEMELDVSTLPAGTYSLLINYGTKVEAVRMIRE